MIGEEGDGGEGEFNVTDVIIEGRNHDVEFEIKNVQQF